MRRRCELLFPGACALVVLAIGCNAILDNEPGHLSRPGATSRDDGAAADDDPASPIAGEGSGSDGATSSEEGRDAGSASNECTTGSKACGGLCVSVEDPFFGCADPMCTRCSFANATATCTAGACAIAQCAAGFADCNGVPTDGCETNLAAIHSCGACGLQCPVLPNVDMTCVGGACQGTCAPGFGNCNGKAEDGCEKDLLKDKRNCGACGTRCVFGRCENGACIWP